MGWEAGWGLGLGNGGVGNGGSEWWSGEGWSGEGWCVGARHQPQPLPPQKAVQIIKTIYAERSEFECQTYPPGISAFAEIASNAMGASLGGEMGPSVGLDGSVYWSAYTARLCHRRVETCHVAVRARAKGAPPPPPQCRDTRPLLDPSRRQLTSPRRVLACLPGGR